MAGLRPWILGGALVSTLLLVPDGRVLGPGHLQLAGSFLALTDSGQALPTGSLALGLGGAAGLPGFELGLVYGIPGSDGWAGNVAIALVEPHRDNPTGVTIGASLISGPLDGGLGADGRIIPADTYYLVVSRDVNVALDGQLYTFFTLVAGVMGDTALEGRLMGALDVPVGENGDAYLEGLTSTGGLPPALDLGVRYRLWREAWLSIASIAVPGLDPLQQRAYDASVSYRWTLPILAGAPASNPAPSLAPSPSPQTPAPAPPPGIPAPPPLPGPSLTGRVLGDEGQPLVGYQVALQGSAASTQTDPSGDFLLSSLPPGPATLVVNGPTGLAMATRSVAISPEEASETTIFLPGGGAARTTPVSAASSASTPVAPGTMRGLVLRHGRPAPRVEIQITGPGVSALTLTDAHGDFDMPSLAPGPYQVRVAGQRLRVDLAPGETRWVQVALP